MGFYIETPSTKFKADWLLDNVPGTKEFPCDPKDLVYEKARAEGLVPIVVVSNPMFDAAAVAYSRREFEEFLDPADDRPKRVLLMPEAEVRRLSPYALDAEKEERERTVDRHMENLRRVSEKHYPWTHSHGEEKPPLPWPTNWVWPEGWEIHESEDEFKAAWDERDPLKESSHGVSFLIEVPNGTIAEFYMRQLEDLDVVARQIRPLGGACFFRFYPRGPKCEGCHFKALVAEGLWRSMLTA